MTATRERCRGKRLKCGIGKRRYTAHVDFAQNVGVGAVRVPRPEQKIAIPQSRSAIATGAILAWARAIGEFGATLMFAGSLPGSTQTWTMLIYQELDVNVDSAYALSAVMLFIAVAIVFFLRKPLREAMR